MVHVCYNLAYDHKLLKLVDEFRKLSYFIKYEN